MIELHAMKEFRMTKVHGATYIRGKETHKNKGSYIKRVNNQQRDMCSFALGIY